MLVLLGLFVLAHQPAWPQNPVLNQITEAAPDSTEATSKPSEALSVESIEVKRAELAQKLEAAQTAATEETAQQLGVTLEALNGRVDRLRALDGLLQQQIGTIQRSAEVSQGQEDLVREIKIYEERGLTEAPPYSLGFAESLQDTVTAERRHLESLQTELESIEGERESAKERLAEAQRNRRSANEAATQNVDPANVQRLTWTLNRAKLEERYFDAAKSARALRHAMVTEELDVARKRLDHLEVKANAVRVHIQFSREELEARLAEVEARRDATAAALDALRKTLQDRENMRSTARDLLQQAAGDEAIASATDMLGLRTFEVETAARDVELAEKRLLLSDTEKQLWERRYTVWQGAKDGDLSDWKKETEQALEEAARDREVQEGRLLDIRATISEQEKLLADPLIEAATREIITKRIETLRDREGMLNDYLAALLPMEKLANRVLQEVDLERDQVTLEERWERFQRIAGMIWNYEVFAYEEGAVTVRKIVIALLVLTIGFLFTGRLCRALRDLLVARTRINENAAAAVEKLFYYLAIVLILLYTLNLVNIPLTLFAFFGGAVAIAVGFGAQHLINNFISGFILMLERPIRIGDLVEIDGVHGINQHVGARSTRLLTSQNIHLLIPNSSLLENTVVNWTLSGEKYCTRVSVGVAYGSPTKRVAELILEAAASAKNVLDAPKPQVYFTDFGDNALNFDVHVWIKMRRIMDKRNAESELRFEIDRLFAENGICIAFPQRDLHLDTSRPLEIRMVKDEDRES